MTAPLESPQTDPTQQSDAWIKSIRGALAPVTLAWLGPFEILRELGRGGQGVIYLARDSRSGQTVAIKRLHARAASSTLCQARLLREAACLQRLDHPFIVACRGVTWIDDEPVLLMHGVDGVSADEWARAQREIAPDSSVEGIITLVTQVCDAVAHAHDRGVLHLDLKPSNIRVVRDSSGAFSPRLLDFGLAISTLAGDASDDLWAWSGGTRGYLAPELRANPRRRPDGRCDTFALGVLLKELIESPDPTVAIGAANPGESNLSQPAFASVQARRQTSALIQRAMQADPTLRYQTAAAMATDLRELLAARPLRIPRLPIGARWQALRPPRRWMHRGAALLIAICIYLSYIQFNLPGANHTGDDDADVAAAKLVAGLVQQSGSDRDGPRAATLDGLPALVHLADTSLSDRPRLAAEVLHAVGGAYRSLWQWADAEPVLEKSVKLFAAVRQFNDPAAIDARAQLGRVLTSKRDPRAVEVLREVLDTRRTVHGSDDPKTIYAQVSLAYALHQAASPPAWDEAESIFRQSLDDYARIHGDRHRDIASCLHNFGYMRLRQRRFEEADELSGRALTMFNALGDLDDPWRLECMHGYSSLLITRERFNAAAEVLADAIPRVRRRFGDGGVQNLLWRAGYVHARLGDAGAMQSAFKDAFATLVSSGEARMRPGPPEVEKLLTELNVAMRDTAAQLPLESVMAAWPCLPDALRYELTDGLRQYAEALILLDDPAAADAIDQFIGRSTP